MTILILSVTWVLYKRINELENKLDEQENEQKRLGEKLKIHEQLIDIKKDIEILKEKRSTK